MNSVREGYKMTELGEIPSEWEVKKLKELLDVLKDGTHNPPKRTEEGIPLLSAENIFNGKINYGINEKCISEEDYELMHKNYSIEKDDILMTIVGTIGRVAVVKDNKKFAVQRSVAILRSNKKVNNLFLTQFLSSTICKKELDRKSNSTAQAGLYLGELGKINIIVPSIKEQEKIASILSTVDEQIDNVDALIEKNKELKKGLMQTLLTKGIGHTKFKKTEIGEIPEEWNIFKLSDCATIIDSLHETPEYSESGFPMIRVVDVNGKAINTKLTNKVCETIYKKFTKKYEPKQGDIIMSRVGSYGLVSYLKDSERVCLGQNIVIITTELCKKYLFYVLSSEYVKNNIEKVTVGSSQKTLSLANINELKILIPSIKEQNKISLILSDIDEKIEKYENKKQKLEELKKGLMQQLLSGQIRVNID